MSAAALPAAAERHPAGLYTLFFTEMWERFSYYGMRALLVLYMIDKVDGLEISQESATAIYGLYTALVYLVALPGGWIADRLLGSQKSVLYGGVLIAAGHFTLAVPSTTAFVIGLMLIVFGTGLLKPNISVMVGQLYPQGGSRRDAGFTIFYMGINLGAFFGPLVCSYLGERINWHLGFGAAGVGMVVALIIFLATRHLLGEAGLHPAHGAGGQQRSNFVPWLIIATGVATAVLITALMIQGRIPFDPVWLSKSSRNVIIGIGGLYLLGVFVLGRLSGLEFRRMCVLVLLLLACAMFWSGFEQAGSSLNIFAKDYTFLSIPGSKLEIPAGWFQSLNPFFIIVLGPVAASLWVTLARRGQDPSIPGKFGWGLILLGLGFLIIYAGSRTLATTPKVWPTWLICTYLVHTIGELCLSPVGLSAVTKLAPQRFQGQLMGMWFLSTSLGNLIAGLFASEAVKAAENVPAYTQMPPVFLRITVVSIVAGVVLLLVAWPLSKWSGDPDQTPAVH